MAMSEQRQTDHRQCANCGAGITETEWHPVRTDRDDDDQLRLRYFCDDDCVVVWTDDR